MSIPLGSTRRRSWLAPVLVLLLIVLPIVEVWLIVQVGQAIGALPTILILIGEAILGGLLMRHEGRRAWAALNGALAGGTMPTDELADAALVLVGGVLLMVPGFITDIFGLFFLLPFTRPLARRLLGYVVARRVAAMGVDVAVIRAQTDRTNIVPGEVVDDPTPSAAPDTSGPVIIAGEIEPGPADRS